MKAESKQNFITIQEHKQIIQKIKQESSQQLDSLSQQMSKLERSFQSEVEEKDENLRKKIANVSQIEREYMEIKQALANQVEELKESEQKAQNELKIIRNMSEKYKAEMLDLKEKLIQKDDLLEIEKREKNQVKYLNNQLNQQLKELNEQLIEKVSEMTLQAQKYQLISENLNSITEKFAIEQRDHQKLQKVFEEKQNTWNDLEIQMNEKLQKFNQTIVNHQQQLQKQEKIIQRQDQQLTNQQSAFQVLEKEKEQIINAYNIKTQELQQLLDLSQTQNIQHTEIIAQKQKEIEELQYKFKLYRHELEQIKRKIGESMVEIVRKIRDDLLEMQDNSKSEFTSFQQELLLIKNAVNDRIRVTQIEQQTEFKKILTQMQDKDQLIDELTHQIKQLDLLLESRKQEIIDLQRINIVSQNKVEENEKKISGLQQSNIKLNEQLKIAQRNLNENQKHEQQNKIQDQIQLKEIHEKNMKEINNIYEERINNLKRKITQIEEEHANIEQQLYAQVQQVQGKYLQSEQQRLKLKEYILQNIDNRMNQLNQSLDCSIVQPSIYQEHTPINTQYSPLQNKSQFYQQNLNQNTYSSPEKVEFVNTQRSRQLREELEQLQQNIRKARQESNKKIRQKSMEVSGIYINTNPNLNTYSQKKQMDMMNSSILNNNDLLTQNNNQFLQNSYSNFYKNTSNNNSINNISNNNRYQHDKQNVNNQLSDRRNIISDENQKPFFLSEQKQFYGNNVSYTQQGDMIYLRSSPYKNNFNNNNNSNIIQTKNLSQSPISKTSLNSSQQSYNQLKQNQRRVPQSIHYMIPNVNKSLNQNQLNSIIHAQQQNTNLKHNLSVNFNEEPILSFRNSQN
ncbi:hypothetical protein TTHERM_00711840 (macronuclear) [Tetrahymena thermophila SB210]|uniref:Uncharacterized protein n=1 Tax=Tetrahymena thermophila (strain SB210) TaxID=312017 RepID=Q24D09_TETTS|nr:hypothetical protein TTHERM_00711840 [Tetrahymena thermophila SB210]EAS05599.2 hypothetical protein TTHERM_00711840 [Tetrahymena thermophila SB210]|eukprot:XP_001025844.2 hypothetical protein TTHERM_00711840 [Tetrahymena thermophila SB210]